MQLWYSAHGQHLQQLPTTDQVLDELPEVVSGSLRLFLLPDDSDHLRIIIAGLLGEDDACSKLITDLEGDQPHRAK